MNLPDLTDTQYDIIQVQLNNFLNVLILFVQIQNISVKCFFINY